MADIEDPREVLRVVKQFFTALDESAAKMSETTAAFQGVVREYEHTLGELMALYQKALLAKAVLQKSIEN
ncbi:MAG TPA: hypothetical protein VM223_09185 [Planctomycetota bacterium]|nr:hypothetical protein [Planctomycetota bacterium]